MRTEYENSLAGTKAAVVGARISGRAAARLLVRLGASVRVLEKKERNLDGAFVEWAAENRVEVVTGEHSAEHFAGLDMIVLSPGVPRAAIAPMLPRGESPEIIAEMELAGRYAEGRILAVTGSNGKTTSTALAGHVLEHAGFSTFVGGNIGSPLADYVVDGGAADIVVLEVSSFQAQCLNAFKPDVAVLLNFSSNHLDWHADLREYLEAKLNLFARMGGNDLAVLPEDMREELGDRDFTRAGRVYFKATDRFVVEALPGEHNRANMEAVWLAVSRFGVSERDMREALASFSPFPHRLEPVHEQDGVLWINDSKSTTLDSLGAALRTVDAPVVLLAGGRFKGGDPADLVPLLRRKVRSVWLFGESRDTFEDAWSGEVPVHWFSDLSEAVAALRPELRPGDTVLLSPAASSFDRYEDYKARGEDFIALARRKA
jgi:UDP-N-acetylmuramoylalanine--D-glutamate ligase